MPFSSTMEKHTVSEPAGCGMGPSSGCRFLRSMRAARPVDHPVVQHVLDRHVGHVGVGDEGVAHGVGQPGHLHQHDDSARPTRARRAALPSRASIFSMISATMPWLLGGSSTARRRRSAPRWDRRSLQAWAGEIVERVQAAERLELGHHVLGHLALVEAVAAVLGDALQRAGERRKAHDLAGLRRAAVLQQVALGAGAGELARAVGPVGGDARGNDEAALGQLDGGRQQARERHGAVILQQPAPAIDGARHGHGMHARRLDARDALARRTNRPSRPWARARPR